MLTLNRSASAGSGSGHSTTPATPNSATRRPSASVVIPSSVCVSRVRTSPTFGSVSTRVTSCDAPTPAGPPGRKAYMGSVPAATTSGVNIRCSPSKVRSPASPQRPRLNSIPRRYPSRSSTPAIAPSGPNRHVTELPTDAAASATDGLGTTSGVSESNSTGTVACGRSTYRTRSQVSRTGVAPGARSPSTGAGSSPTTSCATRWITSVMNTGSRPGAGVRSSENRVNR
jgi:hypothetical protein